MREHHKELTAYLLTCLTLVGAAGVLLALVVFLVRLAWRLGS